MFSTAERSFRLLNVLPGMSEHVREIGAEERRGYVVKPVHRVQFWSITCNLGGIGHVIGHGL